MSTPNLRTVGSGEVHDSGTSPSCCVQWIYLSTVHGISTVITVLISLGALSSFGSCFTLFWRFFWHLVWVVSANYALVKALFAFQVYWKIYKHRNEPVRVGKIFKTKIVPEHANIVMNQTQFVWLRFDSKDDQDCPSDASSNEASPTNDDLPADAIGERDSDHIMVDQDGLSMVATDPRVQLNGNTLEVKWINGDACNGCLRIPYQKQIIKQHVFGIVRGLFVIGIVICVLKYSMKTVPVAFASSSEIEDFENSSWLCPNDGDDNDDDIGSACCSIPWYGAWFYNVVFAFMAALVTLFGLWFHFGWQGAFGYQAVLQSEQEGTELMEQSEVIDFLCCRL